jgi:hypothetical protein
VHGYGGKATGTWEFFHKGLRLEPAAARTDAFFWGYPSRAHKVEMCAAALRDFLGDLLLDPKPTILAPSSPPEAPPRAAGFRYRKLILCAHSMGAVLVRRAMIDLEKDRGLGDPVPKIRLLLFAPAHKGSNLPLLLASGLGLEWLPGAGLVTSFLRFWSPAIDDLGKGSETLRELEEDNERLRVSIEGERGSPRPKAGEVEKPEAESAARLRARVLHAQKDKVVEMTRFDDDSPLTRVMTQGHSSVCKPNDRYRDPVEALRRLL